jgi:acyl-CoA thioesterase FadM
VQFFSAPWEVREVDVAGCGPRLFLTGTKLLFGVWEKLLDEARQSSASRPNSMDAVSWVRVEHGMRALAPVSLRERVICLLSLDELADTSALRVYLRVTRSDGEPVACAFMEVACAQKSTGNSVAIPEILREFVASRGGFAEEERSPSFIERALVLPGSADSLFPESVRSLGAGIAVQANGAAAQRRTPTTPVSIPALGELPAPEGRTAFFFPDVASYDGRLLCELRAYLPYLTSYFDQAEEVARRVFRQSFLPLVDMDAIALHDQRLARCPELAHVGVVLTGVLIAESLQEHGIRPDALIGDGLGELAALAIAGAAELSTAIRLAAQRALAMRPAAGDMESAEAAEQFAASLAVARFDPPRLPIISLRARGLYLRPSAGGSLGTAEADADLMAAAWGAGCEHVIECGPRGFLSSGVHAPTPALAFARNVRQDVVARS